MLVLEKNALSEEIENLVELYGIKRSSLLSILQALQKKHKYISDFAQQEVARLLDIHPVEVYSVISFYSFLHSKPSGRNIVRLCRTISCDMTGKDKVARQLKENWELNLEKQQRIKELLLNIQIVWGCAIKVLQ